MAPGFRCHFCIKQKNIWKVMFFELYRGIYINVFRCIAEMIGIGPVQAVMLLGAQPRMD